MKIKDLISLTNLKNRQFAEKVGLSTSQISLIANEKAKVTPMLEKICRFVFWKEMGIPPDEIIEELGLMEPPSGLAAETAAHYNKVDHNELEQKINQLEDERRILFSTIDNLHKQLDK